MICIESVSDPSVSVREALKRSLRSRSALRLILRSESSINIKLGISATGVTVMAFVFVKDTTSEVEPVAASVTVVS